MPTWSMLSFQDSASPVMEELSYFHDFTMLVVIMITALVATNMALMFVNSVFDRYLLQNQMIEMIWTVTPVFILFVIAIPSLKVLYLMDDPFSPNLTIKSIGHQWYWSYEYSDFPDIEFNSYMLPSEDLKSSDARLLETDNSLVVPVNSKVRVITTSADVIHSWAVPSLGVKADAVPGRLNQIMFSTTRTGLFYGQCSEICGANHSFMPIKMEVVPMNVFSSWLSSLE
uniref:Cytochrome c oxidase subunit 2 n=1 Tax=Cyamus ovalis TaxID=335537 RepID=Q4FC98_CYAOV|nr:cytochrome oxidase subunit II [Cyamus ovalis]AAZ05613.1 cytochrome oxidase subunit II [Cyamus ovalis]AAZ05619.1 cytochrome oxidase subunit II [Cyamus ovalis]AAZ05639.1 cytochrome oxidase subunit II [Cyamus ovalis]AAZ05645.1 cytochrome oxidase subunit II [Cyamus ovalis]